MDNLTNLITSIVKFNNKLLSDLEVFSVSIEQIINERNLKIVGCLMCDSNAYVECDSIIYDINDLSFLIEDDYDDSFNYIIDEMFSSEFKLDVSEMTFLCVYDYDDRLKLFIKEYDKFSKLYNVTNFRARELFCESNLIASEESLHKLLTTYFEPISRVNLGRINKYLKDNDLKININDRIL